ncbi:MAG TPA: DUF309 domain-containing protein [Thermomicrobiales bacterium]|nr:DUF309 domain-containing protein [Thermomicrobiales bacterium]
MGEAWRRVVESGVVEGSNTRCAEAPPEGLLAGVRLFNDGQFYECHEELETIWKAERDPIRYLYQGILQIGVGFHHLRNRNFRGATLLLHDGIDKTSRYLPACMGLDTERLCSEARQCLDTLHELGRERVAEFDWSLVPKVWMTNDAGVAGQEEEGRNV